MSTNAKTYEVITERICAMLERGVVPWRQPWTGGENRLGHNRNGASGHVYRGTNALMTWAVASDAGYDRPLWVTFKQALDLGGNVRKGEKGTPIIYASRFTVTEEREGEEIERSIPFLKISHVFNVAQCDGITIAAADIPESPRNAFSPIEECERIVAGMPRRPEIAHAAGFGCSYDVALDQVRMPERERFDSAEGYYASLFHELSHSTRHSSRLDRREEHEARNAGRAFGCETYAREELVAEISAAFLCAMAGIENQVESSAAYVASWLKALRNDTKMVISAAANAQRAADFILAATQAEERAA